MCLGKTKLHEVSNTGKKKKKKKVHKLFNPPPRKQRAQFCVTETSDSARP